MTVIVVMAAAVLLALIVTGGLLLNTAQKHRQEIRMGRLNLEAASTRSLDEVRKAEIDAVTSKDKIRAAELANEGKRLDIERWKS